MTTMAAVGLPTRKYEVALIEKGRSHWYQVTEKNGMQHVFPGVTGKLGIISKPALVPWAANQGIARAVAAVIVLLGGAKADKVEVTATLIANLIKDAKKKAGSGKPWAEPLAVLLSEQFKLSKKTAKLDHAVLSSIIEAAAKAPDQVKEAAADKGTRAHGYIDRFIKGETVDPDKVEEDIRPALRAFFDWFKQSGFQIVMGDTRVASIHEKFGGSLDGLGWRNNRYAILDWKTSNGIYEEYALQVSAYAVAFEETFGVPVGEAHIVRFGKEKGDFEAKEISNLTVSYSAFHHASELSNLMKDWKHFKEDVEG